MMQSNISPHTDHVLQWPICNAHICVRSHFVGPWPCRRGVYVGALTGGRSVEGVRFIAPDGMASPASDVLGLPLLHCACANGSANISAEPILHLACTILN